MILVGRSYARLLDAASRLDGSRGVGDDGASDVATRAPEEDQQDTGANGEPGEKQSGSLVRSSEKISLLVGDVGELSSGGWMRELEREMVGFYARQLSIWARILTCTGICRHPGQRRRPVDLEHPPQIRPV